MPTDLPQRRRNDEARRIGRRVFDVAFNGALLVSALILTIIVLVREEQYALDHRQADNQTMQPRLLANEADNSRFIPPLD